jgi:hypothetical protein
VHQLLLPLLDEEQLEDAVSDAALSSWGLRNHGAEEQWIEECLNAASAASARESKARALERLLTRVREPAIVFTEYRDTLEWLRESLRAAGIGTCAIHGGQTPAERRASIARFARGGTTLLATDAAGEGLNLQHRCRLVVHYELPWNPARLLQRAGRVDRIGQTRRVHEIALVAADTAETLVIAPFVRRASGWANASGRASLAWVTESRMAEAVFDGAAPSVDDASSRAVEAIPVDLYEDAIVEARRLDGRRVLTSSRKSFVGAAASDIPVTTIRRSSLASGVALIFELKVVEAGEVLERTLAALHCSVGLEYGSRKAAVLRRRVSEILAAATPAALPEALRLAEARAGALRFRAEQASMRTRDRAHSVVRTHESTAHQLVQIGLFERQRSQPIDPFQRPAALFDADALARASDAAEPRIGAAADLRAVLLILPR